MMRHTWMILLAGALAIAAMEIEFQFDTESDSGLPSAISKAVNEAYDMNKRGLEALERREFDVAMSYFDEALRILPDYSDAENNKGVVQFRKGDVSGARIIWDALAKRDAGYAVASYNLGLVYLHERQNDAALRLFERALKANKQFVEAHVRIGRVLLELGKKEKAIESMRRAHKIAPDHPDVWSSLAFGLLMTGDTSGAVALLKKHEDKAEALKLLGRIEAIRKNHAGAADILSKAVSKGANASVLVELASTQLDAKNCKGALATLQGYFAKPLQHDADAFLIAGIAAKECGDNKAATDYFEQGSRKYPGDAILKYNLGQVYFHQKKFDQAESVWEELSDSIQDPSLLYLRALNARRRGDLAGAEKMVLRALSIDERAEFHDLLGVIYHRKGDSKKALEQFRRALKIDPSLRSAQLNLALAARSDEDLKAAIQDLSKRLKTCSGDSCADISFQLSIVYYHLKQSDKAAATLDAVAQGDKDERIYRHIAIYRRELHDWDKAIAALEMAMKNLVVEPQTEYELAETYLLAGRHAKAAERFTSLLPKWRENPWRLHYQLGYAYLEQNDLEKARNCFERSLKSKSDNVAARGLLAFLHNRQGNVSEARELWEKNLKDDPSNPILWINMGLSHERDGKYNDALEHYRKAAMLKPSDKELEINIGNAYAGLERYSEALNAYTVALSSSKRDLAAYNIFLVALKKKDRDRAGKMLELLRREFSSSAHTRRSEAEMSLWGGDTTKALAVLENIAEKDAGDWLVLARVYAARGDAVKTAGALAKLPDEHQWRNSKREVEAQLAFSRGDYEKSLSLLRETGDTTFAARYNLALTAYHAKRYGEAISMAERLVGAAMGNDRADVCRLVGNAAFALKQWQKARQWYTQLSNVEANSSIVQYNLAVASYNLGDIESSWKYYRAAQALDSSIKNADIENRYGSRQNQSGSAKGAAVDSIDTWYNRAVELHNTGSDTAAEVLYLRVVKKNPGHSEAWNNLGAIYGKRGDIDNAIRSYQRAIEKRHDIPETYANLITMYIELEEFAKARQWIIKGLGHNPESELLIAMREKIMAAEEKKKELDAEK